MKNNYFLFIELQPNKKVNIININKKNLKVPTDIYKLFDEISIPPDDKIINKIISKI